MEIEIDSVKDRINRDDMSKGITLGKSGARKYVRLTVTPEQMRKALRSIDWKRVRAMTDEEIERNALDDPDSIVPFDEATEPQLVPPMPDVALLRRRLKLSQAEFATRFGFSVATVRNWEQGRVLADGPARILLAVIANEPQAVIRALRAALGSRVSRPSARSRSISASGRSEMRPKPPPPPTNISTMSPLARSTAALLFSSSTVPLARWMRQ